MSSPAAPRVGEFVRFGFDGLPPDLAEYAGREARVEAIDGDRLTLRPHRYGPDDPRPQTIDAPAGSVVVEEWQLAARAATPPSPSIPSRT